MATGTATGFMWVERRSKVTGRGSSMYMTIFPTFSMSRFLAFVEASTLQL